MTDPFVVVKGEVQQSLISANKLYERWRELLRTANTSENEEFRWTANELKTIIKAIEWDVQDLEEIFIVEHPDRSKIRVDDSELERRKLFVRETKTWLMEIKSSLHNGEKGKLEPDKREKLFGSGLRHSNDHRHWKLDETMERENSSFIGGQQELQRRLLDKQDEDLNDLERVVVGLHNVGGAMH